MVVGRTQERIIITLALFNNKGGVGTTTLTYHLAHMVSRMGIDVLAVDLDPQANLTAQFLDEDQRDELWDDEVSASRQTVAGAVFPIVEGVGDIASLVPAAITDTLSLIPGPGIEFIRRASRTGMAINPCRQQ